MFNGKQMYVSFQGVILLLGKSYMVKYTCPQFKALWQNSDPYLLKNFIIHILKTIKERIGVIVLKKTVTRLQIKDIDFRINQ